MITNNKNNLLFNSGKQTQVKSQPLSPQIGGTSQRPRRAHGHGLAHSSARARAHTPPPAAKTDAHTFTARLYTVAEIAERDEESKIIHPKYSDIKALFETNHESKIYEGYLEGCKILHGYDTTSYKLNVNSGQPAEFGDTINITEKYEPENCYKHITTYLEKPNNTKKKTFIKLRGSIVIDAGGVSKEFANLVGDYIRQKFMIFIDAEKNSKSQNGGAAAAAAVNSSKAEYCPDKKKEFYLSPMDFALPLPINDDQVETLAKVLGYYAFIVSRINSDIRSNFNLGINFSAFALIVLFDKTGVIQKIQNVLKTLQAKPTSNKDNKKSSLVDKYFQLPIDDDFGIPTYKPRRGVIDEKENAENKAIAEKEDEVHKAIDKEIEYLLGVFYAIEELYDVENFLSTFGYKFLGKPEPQLHDEFFRLLGKLTHTEDTIIEKMSSNSKGNTIWDEVINGLIPKINALDSLGKKFREFDTKNLRIIDSNKKQVSIDLFSLGECISQSNNITADAIKAAIMYEFNNDFKIIVERAINLFLDNNRNDKTTLRKFLKFITGSISIPIRITIRTYDSSTEQSTIIAHTCFSTLDVYNNTYYKSDGKEATTDADKITAIIEALNITIEQQVFDLAGGVLNHNISSRTYRNKKHSKKHNKSITLGKSKAYKASSSRRKTSKRRK